MSWLLRSHDPVAVAGMIASDEPNRRPSGIRVHEHQLTCAGMPGVILFYGGSQEESGKIADLLRGWADGSLRP